MSRIHPIDYPKCLSAKTNRPHSLLWTRDAVSLPAGQLSEDGNQDLNDFEVETAWASVSSPSQVVERCKSEPQEVKAPPAETVTRSLAPSQNSNSSLSAISNFPSQRDSVQSEQYKLEGEMERQVPSSRERSECSRQSNSRQLSNQNKASLMSNNEEDACFQESKLAYEPIVQRNCRSAAIPHSIVAEKEDTLSLPGQLDTSPQTTYSLQSQTNWTLDNQSHSLRDEADINPVLQIQDQDSYLQSESEASLSIPSKQKQPIISLESTLCPVKYRNKEPTPLPPISAMRRGRTKKRGCCISSIAFLGYSLCALLVYPLLLVLLPFLMFGKLLCCIPCIKRYLGRELHTVPMFFADQSTGGFYTIVTVLKERLSPERFDEICVDALNDSYVSNRRGIVLKLASKLSKTLGFLQWKHKGKAPLAEHIITVTKQLSTDRDLTHLIQNLVHQQQSSKLWTVYFVSNYKTTQSAVVLLVHQSIATGSNLKNTLLSLLPVNKPLDADVESASLYERTSVIAALWKAPGVFFMSIKLRPRENVYGQLRYNFTAPISVRKAFQIASNTNCSLDALFLSCLAQAYRSMQRQRGRVVFAIPDTFEASSTVFFVNLPVTQHRPMLSEALLQEMDNQINRNYQDAYILGVAGKMSSLLFSRRITNLLAKSVANRAVGVFCVVDCSSEPVFIDDHYIISSILVWPPLHRKFKLSVVVACYEKYFRVCVATDRVDINGDRPDALVDNFVSAFDNIYRHFGSK